MGEHRLTALVLFEPKEEHLWKGNCSPHSGLFTPCLSNICFPSHAVGGVAQLTPLQLQLLSPYLAEGFAWASHKLSVTFEVGSSSSACKNVSTLLLLPVDMDFSYKHTVWGADLAHPGTLLCTQTRVFPYVVRWHLLRSWPTTSVFHFHVYFGHPKSTTPCCW